MIRKMSNPYSFLAVWLFFIAAGIVGSVYALWEGYLFYALSLDKTMITLVIIGVFFIGLAIITRAVILIFLELKRVSDIHKELSGGKLSVAEISGKKGLLGYHVNAIRKLWETDKTRDPLELHDKHMDNIIMLLDHLIYVPVKIAQTLMILGLLGTVYGIMVALSGFLGSELAKADVFAKIIQPMGAGMATAYITTLFGMFLGILYLDWLCVIARLGIARLAFNISRVMWRHILRDWKDDYAKDEMG